MKGTLIPQWILDSLVNTANEYGVDLPIFIQALPAILAKKAIAEDTLTAAINCLTGPLEVHYINTEDPGALLQRLVDILTPKQCSACKTAVAHDTGAWEDGTIFCPSCDQAGANPSC